MSYNDRRLFPRLVAIETTNYCNAKCIFCPNALLERGREHMSDILFESIIEQCREFPLQAIEPFLQGEPFSDPKILSRLELIHRRLPNTKLRLYSNGYALRPERTDALMELGIDHLYISLNTTDPERYKKDIGLDLERTMENLRYLADPKRRGRVAKNITFRMLRSDDTPLDEQDRFVAFCNQMGVQHFIVGLFNYKGVVQSTLPIPNFPCEHLDRLDILSNGVVTLCCMDQEGEFAWGDTKTQKLLDIYRGSVAKRYREGLWAGKRRKIHPCDTCNLFWPGLGGLGPLRKARFGIEAGWYFLRHRPSGRKAPVKATVGAS
jgi:Radical SAM superfamily/Iron-sulfur cluster-binding domain